MAKQHEPEESLGARVGCWSLLLTVVLLVLGFVVHGGFAIAGCVTGLLSLIIIWYAMAYSIASPRDEPQDRT